MYNIYKLKNGLRIVTECIEHVNSISVDDGSKWSRNEDLSKRFSFYWAYVLKALWKGIQKK